MHTPEHVYRIYVANGVGRGKNDERKAIQIESGMEDFATLW